MDIFNDDEMIAAQIEKEHQEWLTKALASAPSSSSLPRSEEEEAKEKTDEEPVKLKTDESSPARPSTPPLLCSPSPPAEVLDERPWDEAAVRLEGVPEEKAAGVVALAGAVGGVVRGQPEPLCDPLTLQRFLTRATAMWTRRWPCTATPSRGEGPLASQGSWSDSATALLHIPMALSTAMAAAVVVAAAAAAAVAAAAAAARREGPRRTT